MANRKYLPDDQRMLNVRVKHDQVERFRLAAEAGHRTVSQELRYLIEQRIAEHEARDAA